MKNKEIDAVKTMREIRNELSKRYMRDIEVEMKDLEEIQRKYHILDDTFQNAF
jgi:hypothetical protein